MSSASINKESAAATGMNVPRAPLPATEQEALQRCIRENAEVLWPEHDFVLVVYAASDKPALNKYCAHVLAPIGDEPALKPGLKVLLSGPQGSVAEDALRALLDLTQDMLNTWFKKNEAATETGSLSSRTLFDSVVGEE